jgi:hypothetical protein
VHCISIFVVCGSEVLCRCGGLTLTVEGTSCLWVYCIGNHAVSMCSEGLNSASMRDSPTWGLSRACGKAVARNSMTEGEGQLQWRSRSPESSLQQLCTAAAWLHLLFPSGSII